MGRPSAADLQTWRQEIVVRLDRDAPLRVRVEEDALGLLTVDLSEDAKQSGMIKRSVVKLDAGKLASHRVRNPSSNVLVQAAIILEAGEGEAARVMASIPVTLEVAD